MVHAHHAADDGGWTGMTGDLGSVLAAGVFLLASHFGVSSTPLRGVLVDRIGRGPYLLVYSVVSALAFWWLAAAYNNAPHVPVWDYAPWQSWVPLVVNPAAVLLVVCAFSAANPSAVGQEGSLDRPDTVRGALRITRNPFLWGVALWALAHMVPNGDAASLLLFGTLFVLAALGGVLIDAKLARRLGERWGRFAAVTSNIPFLAVAQGRQRIVWREIGLLRVAIALVLYTGIVHAHALVFGVPAIPR